MPCFLVHVERSLRGREVVDGNVVVSLPNSSFTSDRPHLNLRDRTKSDDYELLAQAFQANPR